MSIENIPNNASGDQPDNSEAEMINIISVDPELNMLQARDVMMDMSEKVLATIRVEVRRQKRGRWGAAQLPEQALVRILHVSTDVVWCINMDGDDMPHPVDRAEVIAKLRAKEWIRYPGEPVAACRFSESELSSAARKRRDKDFAIIAEIVKLGPKMFLRGERGKEVRAACEKHKLQDTQIYRILKRYWRAGMDANGLVAGNFKRNGARGRGSNLLTKEQVKAGEKAAAVGRRSFDEDATNAGERSYHCTKVDEDLMKLGAREFLHVPRGGNEIRAWRLTVAKYYLTDLVNLSGEELETAVNEADPSKYPSLREFRYHLQDDPEVEANLRRRYGDRKFELLYRETRARTEDHGTSPAWCYQVDNTKFDVLCAHPLTRDPVGRATPYLATCCGTGMITGYYAHFFNAGVEPASMLMLSCAEDKVALCARFGIQITAAEWPCACLPETIRADSELASWRAHMLAEKICENDDESLFDVTICPAYRADLKGMVESAIGAMTKQVAQHAPGYSTGNRKRASKNPMHSSALTYYELNQVIILWILEYNRRVRAKYNRCAGMIADLVVPVPLNLWNWGIKNTSGFRKKWCMDKLKRVCLPVKEGTVSRAGLEFEGLFYRPASGEMPEFSALCIGTGASDNVTVKVRYNPAWVDEVWMIHEDRLIRMRLADRSNVRSEWSFMDVLEEKRVIEDLTKAEEQRNIPLRAVLTAKREKIIGDAIARASARLGSEAERAKAKTDVPAARADMIKVLTGRKNAERPPVGAVDAAEVSEEQQRIIEKIRGTKPDGNS